jgi:hypothetical protein
VYLNTHEIGWGFEKSANLGSGRSLSLPTYKTSSGWNLMALSAPGQCLTASLQPVVPLLVLSGNLGLFLAQTSAWLEHPEHHQLRQGFSLQASEPEVEIQQAGKARQAATRLPNHPGCTLPMLAPPSPGTGIS